MKMRTTLAGVLAVLALSVSLVVFGGAGSSARADNGQDIVLGALCFSQGTNCETSVTQVENTGGGIGFAAGAKDGLAGLYGSNDSTNTGGEAAGVWGDGTLGTGIDGVYGQGSLNGVFGKSTNGAASGVYGQNDGSGYGVAGRASGGIGTLGDSANGIGVWANSQNAVALKVSGRAQFSRSGVATVAGTSSAPKRSVKVTLPITAKSMMTATLQKFVSGVYVVAAVPNVSGGYFTIYLNKSVTTSIGPIAWVVMERP